ncbi:putative signaling protein [Caldilinea aerophila DSM 14535 = NBRC 104270]|uniref:Putative signaling protein n=1 Tax=Caldilinea aerophila (strain DSM 14535 / JCM 11387 / NBRC 104270 / STL-6-O1) TaxID=926550 RepID=I0I6P0_CALAS|nr:putative signaling protein [Caldilinea aerophila DSM 14535 = NBRC 104270]
MKIGEGEIMGWIAAHGQALLAPDVRQDPRYISTVSSTRTLSEVALPIK